MAQLAWKRLGNAGVWSAMRDDQLIGCLFWDSGGLGWFWVATDDPQEHLPVTGAPDLEHNADEVAADRAGDDWLGYPPPTPAADAAMEAAQDRYIDPIERGT